MKLLEVCVDSLASARAAQAGRGRPAGILQCAGRGRPDALRRPFAADQSRNVSLPVRCLMRPRAGDFLYTKEEIDLLCASNQDAACRRGGRFRHRRADTGGHAGSSPPWHALLDACDGAPVTLHRCIDVSRDLRGNLPCRGGPWHRHSADQRRGRQLPARVHPQLAGLLAPAGRAARPGSAHWRGRQRCHHRPNCGLRCPGRGLSTPAAKRCWTAA